MLPFERIIEQTTGIMLLAHKTIATAILKDKYNYKLTRDAALLISNEDFNF